VHLTSPAGLNSKPGGPSEISHDGRWLAPAQAEDVVVPISDPALLGGTDTLYGRVTVPPEVPECRSDNNVADGLRVSCLG